MAVLITGGTKGIGLAIARRFAKPGVDIFMAYKRDDDAAAQASAEIAALGRAPARDKDGRRHARRAHAT